jgi:hypothetical protein
MLNVKLWKASGGIILCRAGAQRSLKKKKTKENKYFVKCTDGIKNV